MRGRRALLAASEAEGEGSVGQVGEDVHLGAAAPDRQHLHTTRSAPAPAPRTSSHRRALTRCSVLLALSCSVLRLFGVHGISALMSPPSRQWDTKGPSPMARIWTEVTRGSAAPRRRGGQRYHVLVEGGLALAAPQGEDGGGRERAEVPQGQGRPAAAQLQAQLAVSVGRRQQASAAALTIQSESVAKQLIHFPT